MTLDATSAPERFVDELHKAYRIVADLEDRAQFFAALNPYLTELSAARTAIDNAHHLVNAMEHAVEEKHRPRFDWPSAHGYYADDREWAWLPVRYFPDGRTAMEEVGGELFGCRVTLVTGEPCTYYESDTGGGMAETSDGQGEAFWRVDLEEAWVEGERWQS